METWPEAFKAIFAPRVQYGYNPHHSDQRGHTVAATLPPPGRHRLFLRLWGAERMTPSVARHILKLGWSTTDEARMRELSARNAEGTTTDADRGELDEYVQTGLTLSILHSRARKVLKGRGVRASRD